MLRPFIAGAEPSQAPEMCPCDPPCVTRASVSDFTQRRPRRESREHPAGCPAASFSHCENECPNLKVETGVLANDPGEATIAAYQAIEERPTRGRWIMRSAGLEVAALEVAASRARAEIEDDDAPIPL